MTFCTYARAIGPVWAGEVDPAKISQNPLCMPDARAASEAEAWLEKCREEGDSCGGVIECRVHGVPAGLGDPVFGKLDAALSGAMMSIGAVKAVEIGDGIAAAGMKGSEGNDGFSALKTTASADGPEETDFVFGSSAAESTKSSSENNMSD